MPEEPLLHQSREQLTAFIRVELEQPCRLLHGRREPAHFDEHAAHASFELSFDRSHPMTVNNPELTARLVPTLERLAGPEDIREVPPQTGAEDFSYFANVVPGFYFALGVVPEGKTSGGHHTPTFYADDAAVPIAMRLMTSVALDFLGGEAP